MYIQCLYVIHTSDMYVFKSLDAFRHPPFLCAIAQLLLQLYFISCFDRIFFCCCWDDFALRFWHWKQKKKTSIRKATNCKAADADAVAAAACVHLLGQLAQSVGNHNKKLILIKRFTCSCRQLRPAARRIGVGVDACVAARVQRERQTERERERREQLNTRTIWLSCYEGAISCRCCRVVIVGHSHMWLRYCMLLLLRC